MSGMGSVMAQGLAFGAGSEIAHQAVRGLTGDNHYYEPRQVVVQEQPSMQSNYDQTKNFQSLCEFENNRFVDCLKNSGEISSCQSYFDMLKECQKKVQ